MLSSTDGPDKESITTVMEHPRPQIMSDLKLQTGINWQRKCIVLCEKASAAASNRHQSREKSHVCSSFLHLDQVENCLQSTRCSWLGGPMSPVMSENFGSAAAMSAKVELLSGKLQRIHLIPRKLSDFPSLASLTM